MQVYPSPTLKSGLANSSASNRLPHTRKATLGIAFRLLPVLLAFLLSSFCITFLLNIKSAGASSELFSQPGTKANLPEYIASSSSPDKVKISSVFTKEVQYWNESIVAWAEKHQLDPNLVALVMQIESCGHPNILSNAGANGLFQVMPFHFSPEENPLNPETNAHHGLNYLARSLEIAENDASLALAGYNGGHSIIMLDPDSWADETRRYVYWGSGILSDISAGNTQSPRLSEWLKAGGESLCHRSSAELGL